MADSASSIAFLTHPELVLDTPSGSLYYANYQSLVKGEGMTDERNSEAVSYTHLPSPRDS